MIQDPLLTTAPQVREIREISSNISDEKIEGFIREVQQSEVKYFLGEALYYRVLNAWDGSAFQDPDIEALWNGAEYQYKGEAIQFNGYAWSSLYFTQAKLMLNNQANVTRFGVQSLQDEATEDVTNATLRTKVKELQQIAIKYQQECEKFIHWNQDKYPEYHFSESSGKRTALSFFKV